MGNHWGLLKELKRENKNHIEALAEVPVDSPWFSGHFPGEPILPGIALVHLVKETISQEAQKQGEHLQYHALRRVRFTQPVRPGEKLTVSIIDEDMGDDVMFHFKVISEGNVVSSGMITAKKIK